MRSVQDRTAAGSAVVFSPQREVQVLTEPATSTPVRRPWFWILVLAEARHGIRIGSASSDGVRVDYDQCRPGSALGWAQLVAVTEHPWRRLAHPASLKNKQQ